MDLVKDPYGNYVVQHVMASEAGEIQKRDANGNDANLNSKQERENDADPTTASDSAYDCRSDVSEPQHVQFVDSNIDGVIDFASEVLQHVLAGPQLLQFCCHKFASNVVERALELSSRSSIWSQNLVRQILAEKLVPTLFQDRYGNYCLQSALRVAETEQVVFNGLIAQLKACVCGQNADDHRTDSADLQGSEFSGEFQVTGSSQCQGRPVVQKASGVALKIMKRYPEHFQNCF